MIRPFLERAETEDASVYTETMTPSNVGLYEHYGFKVVERFDIPKDNLSLWGFLKAAWR